MPSTGIIGTPEKEKHNTREAYRKSYFADSEVRKRILVTEPTIARRLLARTPMARATLSI
jgi:hypothetical protein